MDNSSKDETPLSVATDVPGAGLPQASRRRFIKGSSSIALPAVLTLHAHAAQALESITCGVKAQNLTAPNLLFPGDPDDQNFRGEVVLRDALVPPMNGNPGDPDVPNGIPTYFFDDVLGVWRDLGGADLGASPPGDLNFPPGDETGVGTAFAIIHISATNGEPVSKGAVTAPGDPLNPELDAIITSADGGADGCMASLMNRPLAP